jgi:hypothetical protein
MRHEDCAIGCEGRVLMKEPSSKSVDSLDFARAGARAKSRPSNQKNSIISLKRIWRQVAQAGRRRHDSKVRIAEDVRQALSQKSMRPDENDAERLTLCQRKGYDDDGNANPE